MKLQGKRKDCEERNGVRLWRSFRYPPLPAVTVSFCCVVPLPLGNTALWGREKENLKSALLLKKAVNEGK